MTSLEGVGDVWAEDEPWSDVETAWALRLFAEGVPAAQIAYASARDPDATERRLTEFITHRDVEMLRLARAGDFNYEIADEFETDGGIVKRRLARLKELGCAVPNLSERVTLRAGWIDAPLMGGDPSFRPTAA